MGLDMFMYKVSYLTDKQINIIQNKTVLDAKTLISNLEVFNLSKQEEMILISDIMDFMTTVILKTENIDMEKIKSDYNVSNADYIKADLSSDSIYSWTFLDRSKPDGKNIISVPIQLIKEKYTIVKSDRYLVCEMKKVAQWRKEYDLKDIIHNYINTVKKLSVRNAGYYSMSSEILEELADRHYLKRNVIHYPKSQAIVYHESY